MNSDQRPGFWQRLVLAVIKTLVAIVILAALAVGGYLAFREIQRSFDSVASRIDINRRDLESLRSELGSVAAEAPGQYQQITHLQATADELDKRLSDLGTEIGGDLARQQDSLAALEENLAAAISDSASALNSSQTANEETASLGTAIVALQGDLNDTNGRIDALGGEIDGLSAETEMLDSSVGDLSQLTGQAVEAAAEVSDMQRTVALFHVWQLLTRARLRLVENNIGQAMTDVERAFRAIDALEVPSDGVDTATPDDTLAVVQTRLALSFRNLPDDPIIAARDLESAWDELDRILMTRLLPEFANSSGIEAVEPAAAEIAPTETPEPSPIPPPTPSPTPSP